MSKNKLNGPKYFKNVFAQSSVQPAHIWAEWLSQKTGLTWVDSSWGNDTTGSIWLERYQIRIMVPNSIITDIDQEEYAYFSISCEHPLVTTTMNDYFDVLRINSRVHLLREVLSILSMFNAIELQIKVFELKCQSITGFDSKD